MIPRLEPKSSMTRMDSRIKMLNKPNIFDQDKDGNTAHGGIIYVEEEETYYGLLADGSSLVQNIGQKKKKREIEKKNRLPFRGLPSGMLLLLLTQHQLAVSCFRLLNASGKLVVLDTRRKITVSPNGGRQHVYRKRS